MGVVFSFRPYKLVNYSWLSLLRQNSWVTLINWGDFAKFGLSSCHIGMQGIRLDPGTIPSRHGCGASY